MTRLRLLAVCAAMLSAAAQADVAGGVADPVFDVPFLPGISIDGDADDWGYNGLYLDELSLLNSSAMGTIEPEVRLAWNSGGLLVLVRVADDQAAENADVNQLWLQDSVEFYLSPQRGRADICQWVVAPGMDSRSGGEPRWRFYDMRTDPVLKSRPADGFKVRIRRNAPETREFPVSYSMEVLIPWACVGVDPRVGAGAAFQLVISDSDAADDTTPDSIVWYQGIRVFKFPHHLHRVRLAETPTPRRLMQISLKPDWEIRKVRGLVSGVASYVDEVISIYRGPDIVAGGRMVRDLRNRASFSFTVPLPPAGGGGLDVEAQVDMQTVAAVRMPSVDAWYADEVMKIPLGVSEWIFTGRVFPRIDFTDRDRAKSLLGEHPLKIAFYDNAFARVGQSQGAGRYGAVVTLKVGDEERRRYVTLYERGTGADAGLPSTMPAADRVAASNAMARADEGAARTLAALHDRHHGLDVNAHTGDPAIRDFRWWLRMRKRLGEDLRKLSPMVYAVVLPPGYETETNRYYTTVMFCPEGGDYSDGSWEGVRKAGAAGILAAASKAAHQRNGVGFIGIVPHSFERFWPEEHLRIILDIVELECRVDTGHVAIVGQGDGADEALRMMRAYPERFSGGFAYSDRLAPVDVLCPELIQRWSTDKRGGRWASAGDVRAIIDASAHLRQAGAGRPGTNTMVR